MKRLALIGLVLLAGCSKPKPEETTAPQAAPPAVDTWPGKYEGDLMVNVSGSPGAHRVWLVAARKDGCTGDVGLSSNGEPADDISPSELSVSLPPDHMTVCKIDIKQTGDQVAVSESDGCAAYHGGTCSFNGNATRVK